LRPPLHEFPLLWQNLFSAVVGRVGINTGLDILKMLGPVSLGLLTVFSYRIFAGCLPEIICADMNRTRAGRWVARLLPLQCAVMFTLSDPVWLAGRVFSPEMMTLLLTAVAFVLAMRAEERSSRFCMISTGALSGALFAETTLAVVPCLLCGLSLYCKGRDLIAGQTPIANPIVFTVTVRRMIVAFVFSWIGVIALNLSFYRACGGGDPAAGIPVATMKYFFNYFTAAKEAVSPTGFLLVVALSVLPLLITSFKMRDLCNVEKFLPLPYAFFLVVSGAAALMQSTSFYGYRFWDWDPNAVKSEYLMCMSMLAFSATAAKTAGIFAVEIFFRNNFRLLRETYPDAAEDGPLTEKVLNSIRRSSVRLRRPVLLAPFIVLALIIPFRFDSTVTEMSAIVNGIAAETAAECSGASMIFTDGSYDAAVEVAAAMEGRRLKALSMMSGAGERDVALRLRWVTDDGARDLLRSGSAAALRSWVRDGNPVASNIAVQVGLELWRDIGTQRPQIGGLVARTDGFQDGSAAERAQSAAKLAERMLALCGRVEIEKCGYPELRQLFFFGQWRLSRMCRMRAHEADARGDFEMVEREHQLADRLDGFNPRWREVREKLDWIRRQHGMQLSPAEGLKIALERADFGAARSYSERILSSDPDDVRANFAMAMAFLKDKRYTLVEKHLKKCLLRGSREPAVLNNLAVVQLRLGKLDEAETNALKAVELFSDSPQIKSTLRDIRKAKKKEGGEK
jgi:hypothetical protein